MQNILQGQRVKVKQLERNSGHDIIVVQDTNCTFPRAFISAYVGLETSNHQDPCSGPTAPS